MSSLKKSLIRRARFTAWACRFTAVAIPVSLSLSWYLGAAQFELLHRFAPEATRPLSILQVTLAIAFSYLPTLALARSLLYIAKCFDCFAGDNWFASTQPSTLSAAGRWLVICGLSIFVVPTLLGFVLLLDNSTGRGALVISLSSNGIISILFGSLLWSLGHLWAKANELATENARYV
jgi:hypothetical protein